LIVLGQTTGWLGIGEFLEQAGKLPSTEIAGNLGEEGWMRLHPIGCPKKANDKIQSRQGLFWIFERFLRRKTDVDSNPNIQKPL
jgi:hypothetical protein